MKKKNISEIIADEIKKINLQNNQKNILYVSTEGAPNTATIFKITGSLAYVAKVTIDLLNVTTATSDGGNCQILFKCRNEIMRTSVLYSKKLGGGFTVKAKSIDNSIFVEVKSPVAWQSRRIVVESLTNTWIYPELAEVMDTSDWTEII